MTTAIVATWVHGVRKQLTGHTWLRPPGSLAGQKVCLLACYAHDRRVLRHTLHLALQWQSQGFKVVLVVAARRRAFSLVDVPALRALDGLMLRRNRGYDFGSWADAMRSRPDIREARLLAMTNDSVYGPLRGFARLLGRVESSDADVIAMTDSYEVRHHIQSYLVFYRPAALKSPAFERFWSTRPDGNRDAVILQSEVPLLEAMQQGGLRVATLFPSPTTAPSNPTLQRWRELLDAGFPFVKVQLLRDSFRGSPIEGWDSMLAQRGFDPSMVREHLRI